MEDKITIEKDVFKALASDTRINMLKILDKRRHTQSEIAAELRMSVPAVKEHLNAMEKAGLVKIIDEGYKWKYYELTEKSRCILDSERKKVWIVLGLWIAAAAGTFAVFFGRIFPVSLTRQAPVLKAEIAQEAALSAVPEAEHYAVDAAQASSAFPCAELIAAAAMVVLTALLAYFALKSRLIRKRK